MSYHRAGDLERADLLYRKLLRRDPNNANAWYLRSLIAMARAEYAAAVTLLEHAVRWDAKNPSFWSNLGDAYRRLGRRGDATRALERALALKPGLPEAHFNLGLVAYAERRFPDAIRRFEIALGLEPRLPRAAAMLVGALRIIGERERALAAYARFGPTAPPSAELEVAVAGALAEMFELDQALVHLERALELEPGSASVRASHAGTLAELGHLEEALAGYRGALELDPDYHPAHSSIIFHLALMPDGGTESVSREARRYGNQAARLPRLTSHPNLPDPNRRLRVGYVSSDFRRHSVAHFLLPLFRHHDRARYEVYCYANVLWPDRVTGSMQELVDEWRDIVDLDDDAAAQRIHEDGIDVLVDLSMHTFQTRLLVFAHKPAPVQVCWLAYAGTTGLATMDYRLTDSFLDPVGGDDPYSEQSIRLPDSFWCYEPLATADLTPLPALTTGHVTFGSLNAFRKVTAATLTLWAGALRALPTSRLLLVAPAGSARTRIHAELGALGIASERVEFASHCPREQYLELYHRIDCCLDTVPYGGGTTSLDALWMGVPVLTLCGRTVTGRAGSSILNNLGLPELVATSEEHFARLARDLGADLPELARLRKTLRTRLEHSPLMDAPRFAQNLEAAYRGMWARWCETHEQ
jgi:protein O-GlcNAc transferase